MGREARKARQPRAQSKPVDIPDVPEIEDVNALLGISGQPDASARVLDARQARANSTVRVLIAPGQYVLARKMDMASMLFEGEMPLPILASVQRLQQMKEMSKEDRLRAMVDPENTEVLELMRRHAAAVVIEPKVCWPDDGVEDHMPANLLTLPQLMKIWTETALVPSVTPADAFRFRQRATGFDPPAVSDGEGVRPPAEHVDQDEFIHH